MNKRDLLIASNFGRRIAEEETDELASYFVETEQWRKVLSGEVDVVYGPKGSGKSALYSLLRQKRDDLISRGIIPVAAEKVRGTPVFEDLVSDPPASEEQFRGLWKIYFLSLTGMIFRILKIQSEQAEQLLKALEAARLLQTEWSLPTMLRAALDYVRRVEAVSASSR